MNNINVYYTKLNSNLSKKKFEKYYYELPNILKKKIDRILPNKSKLDSLIGLKLLSTALVENNYPKNILENIKYSADGKPYIPNSLYFNISHSNNIVVCALYFSSIGIDVEKIKPRQINKLISFLSKEEYKLLLKSEEQDKLFAHIWTQKEAFSKAIGKGMNINFADISIKDLSIKYNSKNWHIYPVKLDRNYSTQVCISKKNQIIDIKYIEL